MQFETCKCRPWPWPWSVINELIGYKILYHRGSFEWVQLPTPPLPHNVKFPGTDRRIYIPRYKSLKSTTMGRRTGNLMPTAAWDVRSLTNVRLIWPIRFTTILTMRCDIRVLDNYAVLCAKQYSARHWLHYCSTRSGGSPNIWKTKIEAYLTNLWLDD